jgi:hypothetical protein
MEGSTLSQSIGFVSILVKDYDEAIGAQILLAKASNDQPYLP